MDGTAVATKVETPVAQSRDETAALISMIERAARDPQIDIDKMERLFQMHERMTARTAEAAFNAAMAAAQAELKPVIRKIRNTQTNSSYADLAAISDASDPTIHKHGFGVVCSEFQSTLANHLGIRCTAKHAAGHSETYDFNVPVDGTGLKGNPNKTATHAYASTLTYGRRYAKCCVFDIATKNDTDGNAPKGQEPITPDQAQELAKLITETKTDIQAVLDFHKAESLSDFTAADYRAAKAKLIARKQQMAKGSEKHG